MPAFLKYLFLNVEQRIQKLVTRDTLYVAGMKECLRIHTARKKMTPLGFAKLEELLPAGEFVREHPSFLESLCTAGKPYSIYPTIVHN